MNSQSVPTQCYTSHHGTCQALFNRRHKRKENSLEWGLQSKHVNRCIFLQVVTLIWNIFYHMDRGRYTSNDWNPHKQRQSVVKNREVSSHQKNVGPCRETSHWSREPEVNRWVQWDDGNTEGTKKQWKSGRKAIIKAFLQSPKSAKTLEMNCSGKMWIANCIRICLFCFLPLVHTLVDTIALKSKQFILNLLGWNEWAHSTRHNS